MRLLLVEDEPAAARLLAKGLRERAYAVDIAEDGEGAVACTVASDYDVIVLDLGLPDMSGETVLQQVRCRSGVPVLILSARGRVEERVRGLGLGADDYMTKPFSPLELIARVKALLRRAPSDAPESDLLIFDAGRLEIDTSRREVRVDGALCDVTRTEFDLLLALAEHPGDIQSRASLALALRGEGFDGDERFVDVHIRNLRRKVEDDPARPRRVETVRGGGYRIGLAPS